MANSNPGLIDLKHRSPHLKARSLNLKHQHADLHRPSIDLKRE
jgi:hypothetical protein